AGQGRILLPPHHDPNIGGVAAHAAPDEPLLSLHPSPARQAGRRVRVEAFQTRSTSGKSDTEVEDGPRPVHWGGRGRVPSGRRLPLPCWSQSLTMAPWKRIPSSAP